MNYKQLYELADSITEGAARMLDLANMLRGVLDSYQQSAAEWAELEARIERELRQLQGLDTPEPPPYG